MSAPVVVESRGHRQIPIVCPGHTRPLAEVQFCAIHDEDNNTYLVSACHDKMPMVRNGMTGDWIGTFSGHKGAVWSCRLDPLGYLAATASGDFSVKVWDAVTGKELFTFCHAHIVKTLEFSQDSKRLATGGHEGILRVYDLLTPEREPLVITQDETTTAKIVITKVVWLDLSTVIASGSDGKIRFWNVGTTTTTTTDDATPSLLHTLSVDAEVRDLELKTLQDNTDSARTILTVAAGTKVSFFDVSSFSTDHSKLPTLLHSYTVPIHFREEGGASLHPSGTKFVTGGSDLWVRVFDFDTGKELECLKGHHGPVRCVRYAPDGKTYATGSEDGTIRLWKTDVQEDSV